MIYIFSALREEAAALKPLENRNTRIITTGVGRVNAAFAVGRTFPEGLTRSSLESDAIINIGISCSKDLSGIFLVNKITEQSTGKEFYPDMIRLSGLPEAALITSDTLVADPSPGVLYDMEASAIFESAGTLISPDRMFFIKIVSDSGDTRDINKQKIKSLIDSYLPVIGSALDELTSSLTAEDNSDYGDLLSRYHMTETMRYQALELIKYAESIGLDAGMLFEQETDADFAEPLTKKQSKEVLARVRDNLIR